MTAFRIAGKWSIELEQFVIEETKHGLVRETKLDQDRVYVVQGNRKVQVAIYNRTHRAVLPLSGMVHPDDLEKIHKKIELLLEVPEAERTIPDPLEDSGRNAAEQEADEVGDFEDEEEDEEE